MKNPWMSLWLSAANQAAGTARAFWSTEAARQQKAMTKAMTDAMFPKPAATKPPARRTAQRRSK
jgi:hypothetical protein